MKRIVQKVNMPLPSLPLLLFKVQIQLQRPVYSECIAVYTQASNKTFSLLRIAVSSHIWRWQACWAYSHLSSIFFFLCLLSFSLLSLSLSPLSLLLPTLILPTPSTDSLPLVADPQRQGALFCRSAIVHQHKNTNAWQLKAINSLKVDPLCAWHQPPWLLSPNADPINSSHHLPSPSQTPRHHTNSSWLPKRSQHHRLRLEL